MNASRHTDVLIIGAGPSGLMMAAQLLRYGIHPLIIDSKSGPTDHSKALAVQSRTLEIYRQMGIADDAISDGNMATGIAYHGDNQNIHLEFNEIGKEESYYPFIHILEQSKNERLLLNYLTLHACPVLWETNLAEFTQNEQGVHAIISREGEEQEITCDWLVGADGSHSLVRKGLKIDFKGAAYQHQFFLADLKLEDGFDKSLVQIFIREKNFTASFPMKENGRSRFIGIVPVKLQEDNMTFEDVKDHLEDAVGFEINAQVAAFATYKIHHRMAEKFQIRRCFLIGDAAHIHSPVGGQGMNTGLQDAYNLAWKLAGVIKDGYDPSILKTYEEERIPVAKSLLKTTDRMFSLLVSTNWIIQKAKTFFLPKVIKQVWKSSKISPRVFGLISQTGIEYRNSSISVHHSSLQNIKAGDRLPFVRIYDEKQKSDTDLHAWFTQPGFTLLVIGRLSEMDLFTLAKWIKLKYPYSLNFYYLPYSVKNQHVFTQFKIGKNKKKALIVRPDMHIGYMNDVVDIDMLEGYLENVTGKKV